MSKFNFQRRIPENDITRLFKSETPRLEQVLLCKDLSVSIRNEIPQLLDFIAPADCNNTQNLKEIINLALKPELFKNKKQGYITCDQMIKDYQQNLKFYSANCANILSSVCKDLQTRFENDPQHYLYNELCLFINKNINVTMDRCIAGHFARIFETVTRFSFSYNKRGKNCTFFNVIKEHFRNISTMVDILVESIEIVSIRELLSHLGTEYPSVEEFCGKLMENMIYKAAIMNYHLYSVMSEKKKKMTQDIELDNLLSTSTLCQTQQYNNLAKSQPLNWEKNPIQLQFIYSKKYFEDERELSLLMPGKDIKTKLANELVNRAKKIPIPELSNDQQITEYKLDQSLKSLQCISAVKYIIINRNNALLEIQNEKNFEILVFAGFYCDTESVVGTEAFKLAAMIIYGVRTPINQWLKLDIKDFDFEIFDSDVPGVPMENYLPFFNDPNNDTATENMDNCSYSSILDYYGHRIEFNYEKPTTNMLVAFELFWSVKLEEIPYNFVQKEFYKEMIDDGEKIEGPRIQPHKDIYVIELMSPMFFAEPVLSNIFNLSYLEAIFSLCKFYKNADQSQKEKISSFYRHYLETWIPYGPDYNTYTLMRDVIEMNITLAAIDDKPSQDKNSKMYRAYSNGYTLHFMRLLCTSSINPYIDGNVDWIGYYPIDPYTFNSFALKSLHLNLEFEHLYGNNNIKISKFNPLVNKIDENDNYNQNIE